MIYISFGRVIQNLSSDTWDVPLVVKDAIKSVLTQHWGGRELSLYMILFEGISTVAVLPLDHDLITPSLKVIIG